MRAHTHSCFSVNFSHGYSGTLEGQRAKKSIQAVLEEPFLQFSGLYQNDFSDLYVVCQIFANGRALSLPVRTSYKAFNNRWNWNEWVELPIRYKDLPRNAMLGLTIYDVYGPGKLIAIGGTSIPLFGTHGCLRRGFHDLRVWPGIEADCSIKNSTPGEMAKSGGSEMEKLSKLVKQHRKGRMMSVDWLDRLTFREIEVINEQEKRKNNCMYLTVEFSKFHCDSVEYAIVFFEPDGELLDESVPASDYSVVQEPDWNMENLVEAKHHKLSHSLRKGMAARELKPNPSTKQRLQTIIRYPPTQTLTSAEKSLVWQFRGYLAQDKQALTKFLQSVDWSSMQEADEALELLYKWQSIDATDALELLTPKFQKPVDPKVRKYAIARLQQADNEELLLYLLQLVQALRYELPEFIEGGTGPDKPPTLSADKTYSEG